MVRKIDLLEFSLLRHLPFTATSTGELTGTTARNIEEAGAGKGRGVAQAGRLTEARNAATEIFSR
jgi:hypothetical protein